MYEIIKSEEMENCRFCDKAVELLTTMKKDFTVIHKTTNEIREICSNLNVPAKVPIIHLTTKSDHVYIGGYTELALGMINNQT